MANRLLTGLDIMVELARLDDKTGAAAGYLVSDTMVLRKIDGKSVKYDTIDRLLSMEDFSSKFLKPLVCAPRKSDEIIGPTEIDDPEYTSDGALWQNTNKDAPGFIHPEIRTVTAGLLDQRGKTHGDYTHMSITIQKVKDAMRSGEAWDQCSAGQREALELIATKIGRIVCGDPGHHDHWQDLIGYATKALERIAHAPYKINPAQRQGD